MNNYLAIFQHMYLLLIDCVLVFFQETLTLVLHLGKQDQVIHAFFTKSKRLIFII